MPASILKIFALTEEDAKMIVICAIAFFAFWKVMKSVCFDSLLKLVEAREAATTGAKSHADDTTRQANDLEARTADRMLNVRIESMKSKNEKLGAERLAARSLIERAEAEAGQKVSAARAQALSAQANAERELQAHAERLTQQVLGRLGM